jgi:hypothetical protein
VEAEAAADANEFVHRLIKSCVASLACQAAIAGDPLADSIRCVVVLYCVPGLKPPLHFYSWLTIRSSLVLPQRGYINLDKVEHSFGMDGVDDTWKYL